MSDTLVSAQGLDYRFCPDRPPAVAAQRGRAVLRARVLDELTGLPVKTVRPPTADRPGLQGRALGSGLIGWSGRPARALAGLDAAPIELRLGIAAPGYLPRSERVTLQPINVGNGAPADFPNHFAAGELADIELHRRPLVLRGRVIERQGVALLPLANARLAPIRLCRQVPAPEVDLPHVEEPARLLAIPGGLQADWPAGALVRRRQLGALIDRKHLVAAATAENRHIRLSNATGVAVGDVLVLDAGTPERRETVTVDQLDPVAPAGGVARLRLVHPLRFAHHPGGAVEQRAVLPPTAPANALLRAAWRGDPTLYLDALHGLGDADLAAQPVIEIAQGPRLEYQLARSYAVASNVAGFFALPPLSRVAQITLEVRHPPALPASELTLIPNYELAEQHLDVLFSP